MAHKSIERLSKPTEQLKDDFIVGAHTGHLRWLSRNRGEKIHTPLGQAHIERAAELAAEASLRDYKRGGEVLISRLRGVTE